MTVAERFARLPTGPKLLLILTAVLLPIGVALTWIGSTGIREANRALAGRGEEQAHSAASAIESLIARNALGLRVAAAGALSSRSADPCAAAAHALVTAPAISRQFTLRDENGALICISGGFTPRDVNPIVAPGDIRVWIDPDGHNVDLRTGVEGGMATASIGQQELRNAALQTRGNIRFLVLADGDHEIPIIGRVNQSQDRLSFSEWPIGHGNLTARIGTDRQRVATIDRLLLLLPVLMWVAAALLTWLLVSTLLMRPLKRLERAVLQHEPGSSSEDLPASLGPSTEIQALRDAFARSMDRASASERDMADALEGQRRLVREVHHRVKNNLQVVASLLNIHGRSAQGTEARSAYAGIGRRVGALSIVHRNHFAEMEENRGIALRPLISELTAELRGGAPDTARGLSIDLDLDSAYTTQDVAVAVAFLITEIVEFAMLVCPQDPVEIELRRTSELTARLTVASPVLVPDQAEEAGKLQFERIVAGLAKQLRSPLDRKLGRYSVDLPVFPAT